MTKNIDEVMATILSNLSNYDPAIVPDAKNMKFGIVVSDYNSEITYALLTACQKTLVNHGAEDKNITIAPVPGAYELPLGAKLLFKQTGADAIICLGCVITGETKHDDYINQAVAQGIMNLGLATSIPIIFGVLTPRNMEQAKDRAGGKHGNKGVEAAITAIKMVTFKNQKPKHQVALGFKR